MQYNLPRAYLSYSAYSLWKSSQDQYRKRYYLNEKPFETVETIFGKTLAKQLEDDPNIKGSETRIEVTLEDGLKLLGYLDSFDESVFTITEFKSGHLSKDGKAPWDKLKVRKHKQLVFYTMLVKRKFGKYNPKVELKWFETEFKNKSIEFDGHSLESKSRELQLTGKTEVFERVIEDWEIEMLEKDIINTALEISNDYTEWTKNKLANTLAK